MQIRVRIQIRGHEPEIIEPGPWQYIQFERQYGVNAPIGREGAAFLAYVSINKPKGQFRQSMFDRWLATLEDVELLEVDRNLLRVECYRCGDWLKRSLSDIVKDTIRYEDLHGDTNNDDSDDDDEDEPDPKAG